MKLLYHCIRSYCIRFLQSTADLYSTVFHWSFHALFSEVCWSMQNWAELGRTCSTFKSSTPGNVDLTLWSSHEAASTQFRHALYLDHFGPNFINWPDFLANSRRFSVNFAVSCFLRRGSSNDVSAGAPNCSRRHRNAACSKFPPRGHAPATIPMKLRHGRKIKWHALGHIPRSVFRMMRDVHQSALMCTI